MSAVLSELTTMQAVAVIAKRSRFVQSDTAQERTFSLHNTVLSMEGQSKIEFQLIKQFPLLR